MEWLRLMLRLVTAVPAGAKYVNFEALTVYLTI
jgi:hypothetical protein